MFHDDRTGFSFDYESGASSSCLVLKIDAGSELLNYQIEMIANNQCSNILPIEKRQINEKVNLYYNITSLSTLEYYLKRKKLSKNDFVLILRGIIKAVSDGKKYFLDENSFLIDEKYIFINPGTSEIALIYVPLKVCADINGSYRALVTDMILNTANFDEGSNTVIPQILSCLRQEGFNLAGFDKFLTGLAGRTSVEPPGREQAKPPQKQSVGEAAGAEDLKAAAQQSQLAAAEENAGQQVCRKAYKRNNLLIAGLTQVLLLIAMALLLQILPDMERGDRLSTAGGAIIIMFALDFLLLRKLFGRKQRVEVRTPAKAINMAKREICNRPASSIKEQEWRFPKVQACGQIAGISEYTVLQSGQNSLDTVLLEEDIPVSGTAYLKSTKEDIMEKISINKESFIIGRLKDHVDYISQNTAVGKIHAELAEREGRYFIKDLNSKNGTRINGERISSNIEYELKNNDKIAFADSEYIFINE